MFLATIENNKAVTNTLAIADGVELEHRAVIQLLRKYKSDLEELGMLTFEMRPRLEGQHGGGDTEFAILNEQ